MKEAQLYILIISEMSWFFLGTTLGKEGKTSEATAFKTLQTESVNAVGKGFGTISVVKIDKSKFKIGTLDQLVKLNDALAKVDYNLEGVIRKIQKQAAEVSSDLKLKIETQDSTMEVRDFVESFQWDDTKYPRTRSLVEIAQIVSEKMVTNDTDIKKHTEEYNQLKNQLSQLKKKDEGSFMNRDLGDIVYGNISADNFVRDSKFLRNVIIVVPKNKVEFFNSNYEDVREGVVPKSARDLKQEDKEGNRLIRVVVMENSFDTFITKCKSQIGFLARVFNYNEEKYKQELEEAKVVEGKLNKLTGKLEKRCYYTFSELYVSLIHLKAMRAYIDGVLRFGIPPKFLLTVVNVKHGYDKKLLKGLTDLFVSTKERDMYGSKEEIGDTEDFYPFVYVPISSIYRDSI